MKWRRRVFAFSLIIGSGILCFGPVLSHSLSRRISMQWNADANVESSKISLQNSSISISGLSIEHRDFSLNGGAVFLKFNPERLWYRDCVIESLIAKDVQWQLLDSENSLLKPSSDLPEFTAKTIASVNAFKQQNADRQIAFDNQLARLRNIVATTESDANNKNHRIESLYESLSDEVNSLRNPDSLENPLRSSRRLESVRAKSQEIEKLLAEERLLVINTQQSIETTLLSLLKTTSEPRSTDLTMDVDARELSREIASSMLMNTAKALVPYLKASQLATENLLLNKKILPGREQSEDASVQVFAGSHLGVDVLFSNIRPRITKIIKGRVTGQSTIAGNLEDYEIHVSSTQKSLLDNSGRVSISWKKPNNNELLNSGVTQSFVTYTQASDGPNELSFQIQSEDGNGIASLNSKLGSANSSCVMSTSIQKLESVPGLPEIGLDVSAFIHSHSHLTLNGTNSNWILNDPSEMTSWVVSEDQVAVLEQWISRTLEETSSEQMNSLKNSMKHKFEQEANSAKLKMHALEAQVKERQENWTRLLSEKMQTAREWEAQQIRSSRLP